ncbi:uncharacterized protein LOC129110154 [Anoplopoma fimbria]|uniref:uncharacterized protein LOC129110154 n=1 Tax=Anoplopoma fimbria TaxID=229290 RepID=UPI0023EBD246|nr:uncharacterized protein LOC129110154 [Anoplopoma fimbria]
MLVDLRMYSFDQMKLMDLIDLTLLLILASNAKGESWNISVERQITLTLGSNVSIQCMFTVPDERRTKSVEVYWKKNERSNFNTFDNDHNAFVFHPNNTYVLEKYRGKTELIGNKSEGNCSLKIFNVMDNVQNIYVRVIAKGDNYSFKAHSVSIDVLGPGVSPGTRQPDIITIRPTFKTTTMDPTMNTTQGATPLRQMAIAGPVVAILIIIFVIGIVFAIKHKRSESFTREGSGYYANFSRANKLKREAPCKEPENNKLSELKAIDEPVYINIEASPGQMDQSTDHTDSIYANVDYSKL